MKSGPGPAGAPKRINLVLASWSPEMVILQSGFNKESTKSGPGQLEPRKG